MNRGPGQLCSPLGWLGMASGRGGLVSFPQESSRGYRTRKKEPAGSGEQASRAPPRRAPPPQSPAPAEPHPRRAPPRCPLEFWIHPVVWGGVGEWWSSLAFNLRAAAFRCPCSLQGWRGRGSLSGLHVPPCPRSCLGSGRRQGLGRQACKPCPLAVHPARLSTPGGGDAAGPGTQGTGQ